VGILRPGAANRTADAQPTQLTLWSDREVGTAWNVRISRRARRLTLRVFPGGRVEVVVPPGVGVPAIERFVARHRDWAERRSREMLRLAPKALDLRPAAVEVGLLGRTWAVEYATGRRVRAEEVADDRLRIHAPDVTDRTASHALMPWLGSLASRTFAAQLDALAAELGIDYARMTVRRQRTAGAVVPTKARSA
jgi:predicted metal-dependent hydrolase